MTPTETVSVAVATSRRFPARFAARLLVQAARRLHRAGSLTPALLRELRDEALAAAARGLDVRRG